MNKHFNWLAPVAIICSASSCFAVQYLTVEAAQKVCFPGATRFEATPIRLTDAQKKAIEKDSGISVKSKDQNVWKAYSGKTFLGWFIEDDVIGKHDHIDWALALDPNGVVLQVEIMNYREAYGSEVRRDTWRKQFEGKTAASPLKLQKDIKNITGATLSCRHVTDGVKRLLSLFTIVLKN